MGNLVDLLALHGGLLLRRHLSAADKAVAERACRRGELRAVLPGVYAPDDSFETRLRALSRFDPDAIVTGAEAARASWWPDCPLPWIEAYRRNAGAVQPGFRWVEGRPPIELCADVGGLRLATPALSVLDLIPTVGGRAIDEALRRKACTLAAMWAALALTKGRPGNVMRRTLLLDSRCEPWSPAERELHRLLRAAGLRGWRTNVRVAAFGASYLVDVCFAARRVVLEIDGWAYHGHRAAFEADRWRYSRLTAAGWRVICLPAAALGEPEELLAVLRAALREPSR